MIELGLPISQEQVFVVSLEITITIVTGGCVAKYLAGSLFMSYPSNKSMKQKALLNTLG